jgi:hypothetical protein
VRTRQAADWKKSELGVALARVVPVQLQRHKYSPLLGNFEALVHFAFANIHLNNEAQRYRYCTSPLEERQSRSEHRENKFVYEVV